MGITHASIGKRLPSRGVDGYVVVNVLTEFIIVTGSIARSASLPVFNLLRGRF